MKCRRLYTKAGIPVANVPQVFEINDNAPSTSTTSAPCPPT